MYDEFSAMEGFISEERISKGTPVGKSSEEEAPQSSSLKFFFFFALLLVASLVFLFALKLTGLAF